MTVAHTHIELALFCNRPFLKLFQSAVIVFRPAVIHDKQQYCQTNAHMWQYLSD